MPTYEYVCTECGSPLEAVQSFTDAPLIDCPTCGGRLRKVFSAVGVVFKGSGFYRTDSRSGSGTDPDSKKAKEPAAASPSGDKSAKGSAASSGSSSSSGSSDSSGGSAGSSSGSSGSSGSGGSGSTSAA